MPYRQSLPKWKKGDLRVSVWWALEFVVIAFTNPPLDLWLFVNYRVLRRVVTALEWLGSQPFNLLCWLRWRLVELTCRQTYHLDHDGSHICERCGCWLGRDNERIEWPEWQVTWR